MSGQYLSSNFSLPCPPGLEIPEEQRYTITANTLKVSLPAGWGGGCQAGRPRPLQEGPEEREPASLLLLALCPLRWVTAGLRGG